MVGLNAANSDNSSATSERLSYKFQRLRERIRQAIADGELSGKLPGERELARRFDANPKTLSKALTDLAGEGLLDRSIGRGTYLRGSGPEPQTDDRWLILATPAQAQSSIVELLQQRNPRAEIATTSVLRPTFISQFNAVIDLDGSAPESFYRDLLVRGIPVLLMDREPSGQKAHAVVLDYRHAASCLARDLFLAGHRRVLVVGAADSTVQSVRMAAGRYSPHAAVQAAAIDDSGAILNSGSTAILCEGESAIRRVRELSGTYPQLARTSISAVAVLSGDPICSGIFIQCAQLVDAGVELIRSSTHRPSVEWLTGTYCERGTIFAVPERAYELPLAAVPQPSALSA
jgi:DNA-binding transcriptional regulator YhcF (GntR family)